MNVSDSLRPSTHQGPQAHYRTAPLRDVGQQQLRPRLKTNQSRHRGRQRLQCTASAAEQTSKKKVVVLGGTGRVGSSTAVALLKKDPTLDVVVGSRSPDSFSKAVKKRPRLEGARFEQVTLQAVPYQLEGRLVCSGQTGLYTADIDHAA